MVGWQLWAAGAAVLAALTAVLAKIGVEGIDSNLATLLRTVVVVVAPLPPHAPSSSRLRARTHEDAKECTEPASLALLLAAKAAAVARAAVPHGDGRLQKKKPRTPLPPSTPPRTLDTQHPEQLTRVLHLDKRRAAAAAGRVDRGDRGEQQAAAERREGDGRAGRSHVVFGVCARRV